MGIDGINPNQKVPPFSHNSCNKINPASNQETFYLSVIREGGKTESTFSEKCKDFFWSAWGYIQYPFVKTYEYITWLFQGCPAEVTKLDILENIIEDPKDTAAEFAKSPSENFAELILTTLIAPDEVKKMRDDHKDEVGSFLREFKKNGKDLDTLFTGSEGGILNALSAILNPTIDSGHDLFKKLATLVGKNGSIIAKALNHLSKKVLVTIGEEEKENDNDNVKALRTVFKDYLPKAIEKMHENPESFENLFEKLYKIKDKDANEILTAIKSHAHPSPSSSELTALETIIGLQGGASSFMLPLRQLEKPKNLGKEYQGAKSISLPMAFYQSVIRKMDSDQLEAAAEAIGKNFPLIGSLLKQMKNCNENELKNISENLPEALKVLKILKEDYDNPPKAKKK